MMGEQAAQTPQDDADVPSGIRTVRVFISSPGDVAEERSVAWSVLGRLQTWFQGRLQLVPVLWENEPLLATSGFQQEIDRRAPPSASDVAVFILWSRLGTELGPDFVLEDGRRATGTEWEYVKAEEAHEEGGTPHILVYRRSEAPHLPLTDTRYEERRAEYAQLESFFHEHFQSAADLSFTGSYHRYGSTSEFGRKLEDHLFAMLSERWSGSQSVATWRGSPFRALDTFEAEHAPIFFGRSRAVHEVRQALARQVEAGRAFVLILGRSGNGKSSLARAGVLPLLQGPWIVEPGTTSGFCRQAVMHPGSHASPIAALAAALLEESALPDLASHGSVEDLAALFEESPKACVSHVVGALNRLVDEARPTPRLVLLVDQLEELFTRQGLTQARREAFERVLDALARSGYVYVLATLRSDFYPAFSTLKTLMALKEGEGHYDLPPVDATEIAQIVRGPAHVAGLTYEVRSDRSRSLDEVLIADATAGGDKGGDALPLLEFALTQLEERKEGSALTYQAYKDLGGLEGAIASRAESEWHAMSEDARRAFPSVLRSLVEVGSHAELTAARRRAPWSEVTSTSASRSLVEHFVAARLFVARGDGEGATVAVAHEALLRTWPRMAERIADEAELLRMRGRVRSQTERWTEEGRPRDLLLPPGKPLQEARTLIGAGHVLTQEEQAYVDASEGRLRRVQWVKRAAIAAILVLALGASILALVARQESARADAQAREVLAHSAAKSVALDRVRAMALLRASTDRVDDCALCTFHLAREAARVQATVESVQAVRDLLLRPIPRAVLRGHVRYVNSAEFSPDGTRVLTASWDGTARLWDLEGHETAVLRGHVGNVNSAEFSPDGTRVLTSSDDDTARLWDLEGHETAVLRGHEGGVESAVFSPDGTRMLTASVDDTARLWDLEGHETAVLRGHEDAVNSAVFSPDGTLVLTASEDDTARLWDLEGQETAVLRGHVGSVESAVFSPDGTRVLTASSDRVARLWDREGHATAVLRDHEARVWSAVFSPDGTRVLTASTVGTARLWDLEGHETAVLRGHEDAVNSAVFSPDGTRVLTASDDDTVRLWDLEGHETAVLRGHEEDVESAVFSLDGARVLTVSMDGTARTHLVSDEDVLRAAEERVVADLPAHERKRYADLLVDSTGSAR